MLTFFKEEHHTSSPFIANFGFGASKCAPNQVLALLGPHPPFYYYFLDKVVHKPKYSAESGCVLAYLLNQTLFKFASDSKDKMAEWFLNILRSPLSDSFKDWFLRMSCERLGEAPPSVDQHSNGKTCTLLCAKSYINFIAGSVSPSLVIASCLARACPQPTLQYTFKNIFPLPQAVQPYCQRRDNKYGVFFCSTSTLRTMRQSGLWVEAIDLGAARATGIASMDEFYLQVCSNYSL